MYGTHPQAIIVDEKRPWLDPNTAAILSGGVGDIPVVDLDAVEVFAPDAVVTRMRPDGSSFRELDSNGFAFGFNWHESDGATRSNADIWGGNCYCGKWKCPGCGVGASGDTQGCTHQGTEAEMLPGKAPDVGEPVADVFECQNKYLVPPPEGCDYATIPDFVKGPGVTADTRDCFREEYGAIDRWPDQCCRPPIICPVSLCEISYSEAELQDTHVDTYHLSMKDLWLVNPETEQTPTNGWSHGYDERGFVLSAIRFLTENVDLIKYSACLAREWSKELEGPQPPNTLPLDLCLSNYFNRGRQTVYLVGTWPPNDDGRTAHGGATGKWTPWGLGKGPDGRSGAVIPIRTETWDVEGRTRFVNPGPMRSCAIMRLAVTILHELIHMCETGTPDLPVQCWREQLMIPRTLGYFLTKRYPDCFGTNKDGEYATCFSRIFPGNRSQHTFMSSH